MKRKREKIHKLTLREQIRTAPKLFTIYVLLRFSVVLVMIAQIFNKDWQNVALCVFSLFLFTIPSFIERNWHIDIPDTLEVIILVFIYAAEILGEIRAFYVKVPGWDTALHTITGFLSAAVGFPLDDIINRPPFPDPPSSVRWKEHRNSQQISFSGWICRKILLFMSCILCFWMEA